MTVKFSFENHSIRFAHGGLFAAFSLQARSLSRKLRPRQRKAIVLRFWHDYTIFEVAKTLGLTWEQADRTIKDALIKLKRECVEQPHFSIAVAA